MNSYEFHRRRTERELDSALRASSDLIASRHLDLARLHYRQARETNGNAVEGACLVSGTDKEA